MDIVEIQELLEEALEKIDTLESRLEEHEYHFKAFAEPCAIGSEQIWDVVSYVLSLPYEPLSQGPPQRQGSKYTPR